MSWGVLLTTLGMTAVVVIVVCLLAAIIVATVQTIQASIRKARATADVFTGRAKLDEGHEHRGIL
jgi:Na+-transporting methylmalonyl-CoA/oxaloacetate decarboxylase gamma subunit